jgi:hypothetical protein
MGNAQSSQATAAIVVNVFVTTILPLIVQIVNEFKKSPPKPPQFDSHVNGKTSVLFENHFQILSFFFSRNYLPKQNLHFALTAANAILYLLANRVLANHR